MKKIKILYVEDDETLAFLTKDNLQISGFEVVHFSDGQSALTAFENELFDVCILDVMLPLLDGFDLATAIRAVNVDIPILFLTAKTLKEDKLKGLRLGADDYLVKPFSIEELILKIGIFVKRSNLHQNIENKILPLGNFTFDVENLTIFKFDTSSTLTQREADVLLFLLQHKNTILKRETILEAIWGSDDYFMGRSLDVFISRLRKIMAEDASIKIENIHGIGFRFQCK